jgi:hypothetical protein
MAGNAGLMMAWGPRQPVVTDFVDDSLETEQIVPGGWISGRIRSTIDGGSFRNSCKP